MTWICYVGIEARRSHAVVPAHRRARHAGALRRGRPVQGLPAGHPGSVDAVADWLNPFAIDAWSALATGMILAIFIYWGWDSTVTVNEESEDPSEGPGKAAHRRDGHPARSST